MMGHDSPRLRPAESSLSAGILRRSARDAAPAFFAKSSPERSASARRFRFSPGSVAGRGGTKEPPLSEIAPSNKPFASGDAQRMLTASPPADSPKMVTRRGSPPNAP